MLIRKVRAASYETWRHIFFLLKEYRTPRTHLSPVTIYREGRPCLNYLLIRFTGFPARSLLYLLNLRPIVTYIFCTKRRGEAQMEHLPFFPPHSRNYRYCARLTLFFTILSSPVAASDNDGNIHQKKKVVKRESIKNGRNPIHPFLF